MDFASFLKLLKQSDGFGCGFLVFGCFPQVCNLFVLCFLFVLGIKFLHFKGPISSVRYVSGRREKIDKFLRKNIPLASPDRNILNCNDGIVENSRVVDEFDPKNMVSGWKNEIAGGLGRKKYNYLNPLNQKSGFHEELCRNKNIAGEGRNKGFAALPDTKTENYEGGRGGKYESDEEGLGSDEDKVVDVITLRKMVKRERKRGDSLYIELEKERVAAASAAQETMAMLLRLQSEKSAVEMEAKQYKRIAEQKQVYDEEEVQELRWVVMKHEEERNILEEKLRLCVHKLKLLSNGDGGSDIDELLEGLVDGETDQMGSHKMGSVDF